MLQCVRQLPAIASVSHRSAFASPLGLRFLGSRLTPLEVLQQMVLTRSGAQTEGEAQADADFHADRAFSNLAASCSPTADAPPVSHKFAAVLMPFFQDAQGHVHVVLTRRSSTLPTHSGEVCLPGGKREPGDPDDVATALREAHEELGIAPHDVRVLGCLPPFLSKHLLSVTPVVGVVPAGLRFTPSPAEVAAVFTAPLRMFLLAERHRHQDVEWKDGVAYRLHYFDLPAAGGESHLVWGLTAGMLIVAAERAFRRPAEFDTTPPGARPFTALVFKRGRLAYRSEEYDYPGASAAEEGAMVTDQEAQAALGEDGEAPEEEVAEWPLSEGVPGSDRDCL